MTWFKVDDGWIRHRKVKRAGFYGRALWVAAGDLAADAMTDGLVEPDLLDEAVYLAERGDDVRIDAPAAAARLVEAGLWHDSRTVGRCERCKEFYGTVPKGFYAFHDWADWQPLSDATKTPVAKLKENRRAALYRHGNLCRRVVARDGGRCRYCGIAVDFKDRKTDARGTYDHVDPNRYSAEDSMVGNEMWNVVVACQGCNVAKGERTPEEAKMRLIPLEEMGPPDPPRIHPGADPGENGSRPGPPRINPDSTLTGARRATPDGAGRGWNGSAPVPPQIHPGADQGQKRPGLAVVRTNGNGREPDEERGD